MWYSLVSTSVTTYTPSRRCKYEGMSAHQILPLTHSPVSPSMVLPLWLWEDVKVYLVDYMLCIIDCHICRDIFDTIDIIYCRLPYISGGVLSLKTLRLYIYRLRGTMQPTIICNLFFLQIEPSVNTKSCSTSFNLQPHFFQNLPRNGSIFLGWNTQSNGIVEFGENVLMQGPSASHLFLC
jgi:hypothetical protein